MKNRYAITQNTIIVMLNMGYTIKRVNHEVIVLENEHEIGRIIYDFGDIRPNTDRLIELIVSANLVVPGNRYFPKQSRMVC